MRKPDQRSGFLIRFIRTTLQALLLINEQVDQALEEDPSTPHRVRNQEVLRERPEAVKLCLEGGMDESKSGVDRAKEKLLAREGADQANPGVI